jgi:hypothetical protein
MPTSVHAQASRRKSEQRTRAFESRRGRQITSESLVVSAHFPLVPTSSIPAKSKSAQIFGTSALPVFRKNVIFRYRGVRQPNWRSARRFPRFSVVRFETQKKLLHKKDE